MSLKEQIQNDMKAALKGGDKRRLGAVRLIMAGIKQQEVDTRTELDDTAILAVLDKMVKQRRESVAQYSKAGREDLEEQENFEIQVITGYLPEPIAEDELMRLVDAAMQETGAATMKEMGKVMAILKPKLQGRADMGAVSKMVKSRLG